MCRDKDSETIHHAQLRKRPVPAPACVDKDMKHGGDVRVWTSSSDVVTKTSELKL